MSGAVTLDPASVEAVASRVAELLRREDVAGDLVDASEIARRFGVSRDYVYEHADDLDAMRLGTGPRARLRFDPAKVAERLAGRRHPPTRAPAMRSTTRRRSTGAVDLLPIVGERAE